MIKDEAFKVINTWIIRQDSYPYNNYIVYQTEDGGYWKSQDGEITQQFVHILEEQINFQP